MSLQPTKPNAHLIRRNQQSQNFKAGMQPASKDIEIYLTRLGLLANLTMAISKGIAGYLFHSQALLTDGLHSLTDLVADFIALATLSCRSSTTTMARSRGHWSGKIRFESFGALVLSFLLLLGGVVMGSTSLRTIFALTFAPKPQQDNGRDLEAPDLKAVWVAAVSVLVKEWLYQTTIKVARERKSAVLATNALHHRIDAMTSIVALLTIGCAYMLGTATWCDPAGKLVIAGVVVKAAWENTRQALTEVLGECTGEGMGKLE